MPFNRDSTSYILIFVAVMVGIVAISLAFVSSALQPTIKDNEVLDKKIQILSSVITDQEFTKDFVDSQYEGKVEELLFEEFPGEGIRQMQSDQDLESSLPIGNEIVPSARTGTG